MTLRITQVSRWTLKLIALVLALLPILNISRIVGITGADNLSNDYIESVGIVSQVLSGTYDWSKYFQDTFVVGAHSKALPILVRILLAKFTDWNVYVELYVCLGLAVLRLFLLHSIFVRLTRRRLSWLLWPILSALVF